MIILVLAASSCTADRMALVIGISNYKTQPHLGGPSNDVRLMQDILQGWYGFAPHQIKLLLNQDATRRNMRKEFQRFFKANPNDIIAIYYSGHGTMTYQAGRIEEALVPYDGNPDRSDSLITTRELREWLQSVPAKQVDVILDCCYSGGFVKDPLNPQPMKCVYPTQPFPEEQPNLEKTLVVSRPGQVVISANQSGRDVPDTQFPLVDGSRLQVSALAFLLYRNLFTQPTMTHHELIQSLQKWMKHWKLDQKPGIGGIAGDRKLFGGPRLGIQPRVIPVCGRRGGRVQLMAGSALDLRSGSRVKCLNGKRQVVQIAPVIKAQWRRSEVSVSQRSDKVAYVTAN
jgi:hypothetical protein